MTNAFISAHPIGFYVCTAIILATIIIALWHVGKSPPNEPDRNEPSDFPPLDDLPQSFLSALVDEATKTTRQ